MIDLDRTIDRAAARLTHAEPRPDVRTRVIASIDAMPQEASWRWLRSAAFAAATAVVVLGAGDALLRWQRATQPPAVAAPTAASTLAAVPPRVVPNAALTTPPKKRAAKPAPPEYVSPTPLPLVAVDAIDTPVEIQPRPLSIPQLSRTPIAPGAVTATVLDENGSSRER